MPQLTRREFVIHRIVACMLESHSIQSHNNCLFYGSQKGCYEYSPPLLYESFLQYLYNLCCLLNKYPRHHVTHVIIFYLFNLFFTEYLKYLCSWSWNVTCLHEVIHLLFFCFFYKSTNISARNSCSVQRLFLECHRQNLPRLTFVCTWVVKTSKFCKFKIVLQHWPCISSGSAIFRACSEEDVLLDNMPDLLSEACCTLCHQCIACKEWVSYNCNT